MPRPPRRFFTRHVLDVARDLLGCVLLHQGVGGPIVECEAYHEDEASCHAHRGATPRTRSLFLKGGHLYVYRIHQSYCANVVAMTEGVGGGVLVRALLPVAGREEIARRRGHKPERAWTDGPGKVCQALGLDLERDGLDLTRHREVRLLDRGLRFREEEVITGPRVGISKARDLPWRFRVDPELVRERLRATRGARR